MISKDLCKSFQCLHLIDETQKYSDNAIYLYKQLQNIDLKNSIGRIEFSFGEITFNIDDTCKDICGAVIQQWVGKFMDKHEMKWSTPKNTQEFPDYFLEDKTKTYLEVKSFDYNKGAAFDIANFESYTETLKEQPDKINTDYLIFGYTLNKEGELRIRKIWLKKIWEICCSSACYALKVQQKKKMIYNIRPSSWYSSKSKFKSFSSKKEFIIAFYKTLKKYPKTTNNADDWFKYLCQIYWNEKLSENINEEKTDSNNSSNNDNNSNSLYTEKELKKKKYTLSKLQEIVKGLNIPTQIPKTGKKKGIKNKSKNDLIKDILNYVLKNKI